MKTFISSLIAFSLASTLVVAQDDDGSERIFSIGLHGGYGLATHSASFSSLPSVPDCCPEYTGGSGGGLILGIDAALPLGPTMDLALRLGYQSYSGTMTTDEQTTVRVQNEARQTLLRHTLETTVSTIIIEPAVEYRIQRLGLMGGIRLGLASSGDYETQETLADASLPWGYQGGASTYLASKGSLTNVSGVQIGLLVGARYHLVIASALKIIPEIVWAPSFSNNVQDTDWSTSAIRFGLGISYSLTRVSRLGTPIIPGGQ